MEEDRTANKRSTFSLFFTLALYISYGFELKDSSICFRLKKSQFRGKYDMVRLLLKLGSSPNTTGSEDQEGDITPIDACIFGCSITPPEYGRNVTSANWLEYFEDHFRNL